MKRRRTDPASPELRAAVSEHRRNVAWTAFERHHADVVEQAVNSSVHFHVDPEHPDDGYILTEQGVEVSRWREPDAPGLAAWLMTRLHERKSALILARKDVVNRRNAGVYGADGAAKRDPRTKYPAVTAEIRRCLKAGGYTTDDVRKWRGTGIAKSTLHDLIKRIDRESNKK
jgi:hypothetical protein